MKSQDSGNHDLVAKGAKRLVVDYSSPSSLSTALSGTDVVVTTIRASPDSYASHVALAKASKEAGVKLYVPSEFGSPASSDNPLFDKEKFKNGTLRELDLPFAAFYTGAVSDFVPAPCVLVDLIFAEISPILAYLSFYLHRFFAKNFGFDIAGGKINIKGLGEALVSFTTREDIASYLGYVLTSLPRKDLEWREFRIEGDRVVSTCVYIQEIRVKRSTFHQSSNEIANIFVNRLGKKVEVTHEPREVLEEALKKNPSDFRAYLLWVWDTERGLVGSLDQLDNKEYPGWNPKKVADLLAELYA